jgi:hypothetical protein
MIACGIMVFSAMNVMSQYNWFTCTVDQAAAGTTFTTRPTCTEDPGGGDRTISGQVFTLYDPIKNQMFAVLLTAMTNSWQVKAYMDLDVGVFPEIYGLTCAGAQ